MRRKAKKVKNQKWTESTRDENDLSGDECMEQLKRDESNISASDHMDMIEEHGSESFWEDGKIPVSSCEGLNDAKAGVTVEFDELVSSQRKSYKRFTAKEKELAELVHSVHLLCLLGRGILIDTACNDPLIQVAALSVALMRALGLPVRYVFSFDVAPLKPDADLSHSSNRDDVRLNTRIPASTMSTTMSCQAPAPQTVGPSSVKRVQQDLCPRREKDVVLRNKTSACSSGTGNVTDENAGISASELCSNTTDMRNSIYSKTKPSKGDLEFEMQLQMALSATAVIRDDNSDSCSKGDRCSSDKSLPKKMKTGKEGCSESISRNTGAVWSRKNGPPLYWAEVFCSGESLTGRWIHIDAASGLIDGEQKVDAAAAACRKQLRYVVAFAGNGAKDVTRR